jgi:diguanylate cyclase (GGDEF)-like protein
MNRFKNILKKALLIAIGILLTVKVVAAEGELFLTEEERDYIAKSPVLKGVTIEGVAPLHYTDSKDETKGITIRVFETISEMTGLKFEYGLYDSVEEALQSDYDLYLSAVEGYAPDYMVFSRPYLKSETILFMNSSVDVNELDGKVYAGVEGGSLPEGVRAENAIYFGTREEALDAVEGGKADYSYGNAYSVAYYTLLNGYKNIITVPKGKESREYCVGLPGENEILLSIINNSIDAIDDGQMQTLILDVTSHIERKLSFSTIMDSFGSEIFGGAFVIITLLTYSFIYSVNTNKKLRMQNKRYETLAHISNEYIYDFDTETDRLELSEGSIQLFGTEEKLEKAISVLKNAIFKNGFINMEHSIISDEVNEIKNKYDNGEHDSNGHVSIIELPLAGGETGVFKAVNTIVKDDKGKIYSVIGKLADISEEIKEKEILITKSRTDGLTGLHNAATSKELISKSIKNKSGNKTDALLLIDCDRFKEINDTLGHLKGDEVLINISKAMKLTFRQTTDILGRVGGDEFCVYMKDIPSNNFVKGKCRQLSGVIQKLSTEHYVTVSIGIVFLKKENSYEELFEKADSALYRAKDEGGARCIIYKE